MLSHHRGAKRHLNGLSLAATFSGILIISPLINLKKKKKKCCQSWTPLTKVSGSAHDWDVKYQLNNRGSQLLSDSVFDL